MFKRNYDRDFKKNLTLIKDLLKECPEELSCLRLDASYPVGKSRFSIPIVETPITWAVRNNQLDLLASTVLLQHANIEDYSSDNLTASFCVFEIQAGSKRQLKMLKFLMESGFIPQSVYNLQHQNLLMRAVELNNLELVKYLAEILPHNEQDDHGDSALHLAAKAGHETMVDFLLELPDINITLQNKDGHTPEGVAYYHKKLNIAEKLIKKRPFSSADVVLEGSYPKIAKRFSEKKHASMAIDFPSPPYEEIESKDETAIDYPSLPTLPVVSEPDTKTRTLLLS